MHCHLLDEHIRLTKEKAMAAFNLAQRHKDNPLLAKQHKALHEAYTKAYEHLVRKREEFLAQHGSSAAKDS